MRYNEARDHHPSRNEGWVCRLLRQRAGHIFLTDLSFGIKIKFSGLIDKQSFGSSSDEGH
jgi:hypothetical protein